MSRTAPQSTIPPWRHRWRRGVRDASVLMAVAIVGQAAAADFTARLLGRWPDQLRGQVHGIVVSEGFAYVGLYNSGLKILDVRDPATPKFVSDLDLDGPVDGLAISGELLFLSNRERGLQVINVADQANPSLVATLPTGGPLRPVEHFSNTGANLAVSGSHVFLADGKLGFKTFDVSDPAQPRFLNRVAVPATGSIEAVAVAVSGSHAYVACAQGGLWVIDVSDPALPTRVATIPVRSGPGFRLVLNVAASGDVVCYSDGHELVVLDVSNPAMPRQVAAVAVDGARQVALSGTLAFVGTNEGRARSVDISDPAQPRLHQFLNGVSGHLAFDGEHAFGGGSGGLVTFDLRDAEQPRKVGKFATQGSVDIVMVKDGRAYVLDTGSSTTALEAVDVRDAAMPRLEGRADGAGGWSYSAAVSGDHVYVTAPGVGIVVHDISRPGQPVKAGLVENQFITKVVASSRALYVLDDDGRQRLSVFTLDNPAAPKLAGSLRFDLSTYISNIEAGENHVYATGISAGRLMLRVFDVSNPASPRVVSTGFPAGDIGVMRIVGSHAYAAVDTTAGTGNHELWIYDLGNPAQPQRVGRLILAGRLMGLTVSGKYAYVSTSGRVLHLVDVSDPARPRRLGQTLVPAPAQGPLVVAGGRIYVPGGSPGLFIYTDPLAMIFSQPPKWETGGVRMTLQGPPGGAFEIQRTGDFQNWATWIEGVFGDTDTGGLEFFDETAGSNPFQFYRARQR